LIGPFRFLTILGLTVQSVPLAAKFILRAVLHDSHLSSASFIALILANSALLGRQIKWPICGHARHISASSDSDDCLQVIKSWLSECNENYPECAMESRSTFMPTRVIDVHTPGSNPSLHISESGEAAPYVCLSHRWCEKQMMITTKCDLEDWKQSITVVVAVQDIQRRCYHHQEIRHPLFMD
jgi:hypothetical protein